MNHIKEAAGAPNDLLPDHGLAQSECRNDVVGMMRLVKDPTKTLLVTQRPSGWSLGSVQRLHEHGQQCERERQRRGGQEE